MKERPKILITGASSGVGQALTNHLKGQFHVIVVARRYERLLNQFGEEEYISCYHADFSNMNELDLFTEQVVREHGYIPYLINNAGVNESGDLCDLPPDTFMHSFNTNAYAPLLLMKKVLVEMKRRNFGRIINVTSGAPLNCYQGYAAYSASKAYLNAITVTAAKELVNYNIKVNLMSPGPVKTEMAPNASLPADICFPTVDYLLNLEADGVTGKFFWLGYEVPLFPDLSGVNWLEGNANGKLRRVLNYE